MRSAFLLLCFIAASSFALAQEEIADNPLFPKPRPKRVFIGPLFGYNSELHSGGFQTLGGGASFTGPDCGAFTTGGGNGIILGLAGEYWFKNGGPTALQVRAYYEQKPGKFVSTSANLPIVDPNGNIVYFERSYEVTSTLDLINLEITYKYNFPGSRFGVGAGPKFGFKIGSSYEQVQKLKGPVVFNQSNTQELVQIPKQEIPGGAGFRFGLLAHLQYEILAGPFLITPRILFDYGVTAVTGSWSVSSLAGTIEAKYGF